MQLQFYFENEFQLGLWQAAVNGNVTFNILPKFDKKHIKIRRVTKRHSNLQKEELSKMKF